MEQTQCNMLIRWFIGLAMVDAVWVPTVFTKHPQRLIEHDAVVARECMRKAHAHASQYEVRDSGQAISYYAGKFWFSIGCDLGNSDYRVGNVVGVGPPGSERELGAEISRIVNAVYPAN